MSLGGSRKQDRFGNRLTTGKIRKSSGNDQPQKAFDRKEHKAPKAKSFHPKKKARTLLFRYFSVHA